MVTDQYGIRKLYPSSTTNPQEFFLPMTVSGLRGSLGTLANRLYFTGTLTSAVQNEGDDTILFYEVENDGDDEGSADIGVLPNHLTPATAKRDCVLDHGDAAQRGYTDHPKEWKNVEMTGYFRVNEVSNPQKWITLESRRGIPGGNFSPCCSKTSYGVDLFWASSGVQKGDERIFKQQFGDSYFDLGVKQQSAVPDFYQRWFGVKFCLFNMIRSSDGKEIVKLELYISPSDRPEHFDTWLLVDQASDFPGKNWNTGGLECGGNTKDQPISWASLLSAFRWEGAEQLIFKYLSVREINPNGTFGEDPEPPPVEEPEPPDTDPGEPPLVCPSGKHEENGICVLDNPDIPPVDVPPPATISTLTKRLTIRREIINSSLCSCDGIPTGNVTPPPNPPGGGGGGNPPPGGGGSGGGGGSNTLPTIYNVLKTDSFVKLASVDGSDDYYLRYGQGITQTNSPLIGAYVARIQITIAEKADPRGGTGAGVHCRIRKGTDDSIAATFLPVALEGDILNAGKLCVFDNLDNEYALVYGDKILFEYDGGDRDNYIKLFRSKDAPNNGTKTVWQDNEMDAGEYDDDADWDICMRVYKKESIINPQHDEDDP